MSILIFSFILFWILGYFAMYLFFRRCSPLSWYLILKNKFKKTVIKNRMEDLETDAQKEARKKTLEVKRQIRKKFFNEDISKYRRRKTDIIKPIENEEDIDVGDLT